MREILKDCTKEALINLDQSKVFDRVDHRLLAIVLEAAGFQPEFSKWITTSGGAVEREALGGVRDRAVGPAGMPLVSSLSPRFGAPAPEA